MSRGRTLITMLLLVMTGCESHTWPLRYTNPLVADAKQGQDCRHLVFGLGGMADVTGAKAMRQGGITTLRSAEYQVNTIQGLGRECVIAHGE
ncbi:MAG: TRL domain-containing protein [Nitrospira sp.]|nr:TRL domain-containing protein [Nitrospira sp.]